MPLKKNIVYNLVDRAISLSYPKLHPQNMKIVRKILLDNDYESFFIDKNMKTRRKILNYNNKNQRNLDKDNDNNNINRKMNISCIY